jgi:hypothetical protein
MEHEIVEFFYESGSVFLIAAPKGLLKDCEQREWGKLKNEKGVQLVGLVRMSNDESINSFLPIFYN